MRTSSLFACLLLAACGGKTGSAEGSGGEKIACALEGKQDFSDACTVQRETSDRGVILTVSAPDESFRRLLVTDDGRGVIAADGAEAAAVIMLGNGLIEVALGADRYRLPATIKARTGRTP